LQFRRDHAALFREGEYLPLRVGGEYAANVCAFARRHEGKLAVTIAPRLYLRLLGPEREDAPLGDSVWGDTTIELPKELIEPVSLQNLFDGQAVLTSRSGNRITVRVADALRNFPVGLLTHISS
jgi:(1->4)-alpha-D-glucan 1-alpha-D-glucosylmutase